MTCYDFRGIAVSPIISNVFEYCILEQFDKFLTSCDVQFGFKKGLGCRNAIYTVHKIVENWLSSWFACVKWHCSWSLAFKVSSGVRQGSVLSPYFLQYM